MKIKALTVFVFLSSLVFAQNLTERYIERWASIAVQEMHQYGIPASITLAQGILESGNGQSYLALEANNHFGIKCHRDWEGAKVYHDDDRRNECFRAYEKAEESFRDHSLFLTNRSRYATLFEEELTDYKAWAKGLKKAGYATNRRYDRLLIDLIERYQLQRYDLLKQPLAQNREPQEPEAEIDLEPTRGESDNRVDYLVAKEGDGFEDLALISGRKVEELLRYNELRYDAQLHAGQVIYIQPKKRKAARKYPTHVVKNGETMYTIAQRYAIKLEELYKRNEMPAGSQAKEGQRLKLR